MKIRSLLSSGIVLVSALIGASVAATAGSSLSGENSRSNEEGGGSGHIVVFNMYYAKPGKAGDVVQTRLYASVVRNRLGLPRGRVLRRVSGSNDLPDVLWECEFPDVAAHDRDMDARAASDAFEGVRDRMRTLIGRFERTLWNVENPLVETPVKLTSAGLSSTAEPPGGVVVLNWYYAKLDRRDEVLHHRVHASDVREQLGHPRGRVLKRIDESVGELPEVLWQVDYGNSEARKRDVKAVGSTEEFKEVMEHMGTLVRDFKRGVWVVQEPLGDDAELPTP